MYFYKYILIISLTLGIFSGIFDLLNAFDKSLNNPRRDGLSQTTNDLELLKYSRMKCWGIYIHTTKLSPNPCQIRFYYLIQSITKKKCFRFSVYFSVLPCLLSSILVFGFSYKLISAEAGHTNIFIAISPSQALGCYWLDKKIPAKLSDCTLALR